jgi:hypothetical protein
MQAGSASHGFISTLLIVSVVMFLLEYMGDFRSFHGVHQFLNLVMAHFDAMQRIEGEDQADQ